VRGHRGLINQIARKDCGTRKVLKVWNKKELMWRRRARLGQAALLGASWSRRPSRSTAPMGWSMPRRGGHALRTHGFPPAGPAAQSARPPTVTVTGGTVPVDSCHLLRTSLTISYVLTYDIVCRTYDIVPHIAVMISYVRYIDSDNHHDWHTILYVRHGYRSNWSLFKRYRISTHDIVGRTDDIVSLRIII
jgi:hypothetical protein